ncbi:MAG: dihydrofolate reductase, partial [Bacteriovoracaceae bacterium]
KRGWIVKVSIVVGIGNNREIGLGNKLLWHLSEDLKRFKKITMGHHMIMGRKTFESIGKALPGRTTIVISRNNIELPEGVLLANSLDNAINMAKDRDETEVMIVGGAQIYSQAVDRADKIYLSRVDFSGEADTYFPPFEHLQWDVENSEEHPAYNGQHAWKFEELKRNK